MTRCRAEKQQALRRSKAAVQATTIMTLQTKFVASALKKGQVIPFLGSAASIAGVRLPEHRLPDARELAGQLMEHFTEGRGQEGLSLTKAAQYCEECVAGRTPVYEMLRETFYVKARGMPPSPVAEMLASIDTPMLLVTTNYDKHLENAFTIANRRFSVVTHITNREHPKWGYLLVQNSAKPDDHAIVDPNAFSLSDYQGQTIVYKLHGTFGVEQHYNPAVDTIVITEDDYIEFMVMTELKSFPPALAREFQKKHFLFLGYSLEDWNFRVILRKIQLTAEIGQDYASWAIQLNPSEIERQFWAKRGIDVYNMDLADFTSKVGQFLRS